jgi:hypothetical protein
MNAPIRAYNVPVKAAPQPKAQIPILGYANAGPGPMPDPWITSHNSITYLYNIIVGTPTGGAAGNGTINAQDLFINGVSVSAHFGNIDCGTY